MLQLQLLMHLHLQCVRFVCWLVVVVGVGGGALPTLFINTYAALIAASLPDLVVLLLVARIVVVLCRMRMRSRRRGHQLLLLLLLLLDVVRMHAPQVVVDHRSLLLAERADATVAVAIAHADIVGIPVPLILGHLAGDWLARLHKVRHSGP
ncbi:hypothetical protein M5D96_007428 [Drosophila gunungcola]|uniref:Uncharacterized protein n=1 Tax=Drosophila gunungcola TaxID=103775 RepID=A0A9P9YNJ2_9MUSC|nr:hypothetical protein M5D96_007428 [Drosophila gunungcola]